MKLTQTYQGSRCLSRSPQTPKTPIKEEGGYCLRLNQELYSVGQNEAPSLSDCSSAPSVSGLHRFCFLLGAIPHSKWNLSLPLQGWNLHPAPICSLLTTGPPGKSGAQDTASPCCFLRIPDPPACLVRIFCSTLITCSN